jgi:hypothetical protein
MIPRSYTDFLRLVEVAAEWKRGASVHGQKKCSLAGRPIVTVTLENRLSKAVTRDKGVTSWREVYSHVKRVFHRFQHHSRHAAIHWTFMILPAYLVWANVVHCVNRRQCATVRVPASFDMLVFVTGKKEQWGRNQTKLQTLSYNCSTNIVENLGTVFLLPHEWSWH